MWRNCRGKRCGSSPIFQPGGCSGNIGLGQSSSLLLKFALRTSRRPSLFSRAGVAFSIGLFQWPWWESSPRCAWWVWSDCTWNIVQGYMMPFSKALKLWKVCQSHPTLECCWNTLQPHAHAYGQKLMSSVDWILVRALLTVISSPVIDLANWGLNW